MARRIGSFSLPADLPPLPNGWRWLALGELVDQQRGICYGIVQPGSHYVDGVPMVNTQDIFVGSVNKKIAFRVSKELHDQYRRSTLRGGEILITVVGAYFGRVAIAPFEYMGFNCSRAVAVVPVTDNAQYVMYALRSTIAKHYMSIWATTTAQPTFNLKDVANLPIAVAPYGERGKISEILETLDSKIELNQRMNETLESMACAVFKSWFVDFDPVRAKAEARGAGPGLPKPLADLFPDRFEESELGEIPVGWKICGLDEVANYLNGLALQKFPCVTDQYLPVIKIAQLRAGNTEGADRCGTNVPPQYIVEDGDVLFSWSGSLEVEIWCGGRGALNQHLFKVTSKEFPKWFYYFWTRHHLHDFQRTAAGKATTMGHIQRRHLSEAKVLVPPIKLLEVANKYLSPCIERLVSSRIEGRILSAVRDTLLPKLLSGQIRVKDAERLVESVA